MHIGESLPESDEKPLSAVEAPDDAFAEDGETPAPTPPTSKSQKTLRPDSSRAESKTLTPETQTRTLEDMRKRLKKNKRPGDTEE